MRRRFEGSPLEAPAPRTLSIILPFYANPTMLREQYRIWNDYPQDLKTQIEIVIVDDGSPMNESAATVPWPLDLPQRRLYRVPEDIPWHQHGARNLGAHEAVGDWLYLSDIDHVIPAESLALMLRLCNYEAIYTFGRVDAPDMRPTMKNGVRKPHPNTFLMPKKAFWTIGGYDEDLTGYGTDGFFRARLKDAGIPITHREDIRIVRYSREVIADASTRTLPRKEGRSPEHRAHVHALARHKALTGLKPTVLNFEWRRIL
jgi:hypothetical protein